MKFVVVDYMPDQAGQDIRRSDVIRATNGRWYTETEVAHFRRKSPASCPTYGTCTRCYSSGPVGLLCHSCRTVVTQYVVVHYHNTYDFADLILDSENLAHELNGQHWPARADRIIPDGLYNPPEEHWPETRLRLPNALNRIVGTYMGPDPGPTVNMHRVHVCFSM